MVQNEAKDINTQNSYEVNRQHKDCLFRIAFREKKDLLELYNAINGSDYKDPEELIVYTLEDVVFLGIKNDISFLMGEMLNLYEHQSTKDPNMPIRGLFYFARNYEAYVAKKGLDLYSSTQQKLPFPQYYVLYNGVEDEEDRCTIELTDAFPVIPGVEPCLKCTATLLNINYGHNREIMERCKTLNDYALFIQRIRDNQKSGMEIGPAVRTAVESCIEEGILREILLKNRAEVESMVLGTWGTENHLRKVREKEEELEQKRKLVRQQEVQLENQKIQMKQQEAQLENQKIQITQMKELERRQDAANLLSQKLLDEGRIQELKRTLTDTAYQAELLKEYKMLAE